MFTTHQVDPAIPHEHVAACETDSLLHVLVSWHERASLDNLVDNAARGI
jgi:hypothetical protein